MAKAGEQAKILIVEDDERAAELLVEVLERRGYRAQAVRDGQRAWRLLRREEPLFDLVITDLNMPTMDGWELLRRVHRDSLSVRVILLTSLPEPEVAAKARELRACAVLSKPCDLGVLLRAVKSALSQPASPKATTRENGESRKGKKGGCER